MNKFIKILIIAALATAGTASMAQTKTATKGTTTKAAPVKPQTKTKTKTTKTAKEDSGRVAGFVKGQAKGTSFTLGAKGGPFEVNASKAKVAYKGKSFKVSDLKGGDAVVVSGKMMGKKIDATEVKVTFVRDTKAKVSKTTKTEKPTKGTTTKPKNISQEV